MEVKIPRTPTYWYCPTCGKWDSPRVSEPMATPEHQPYRGVDVGTCEGIMIPLYSEEDIQMVNK